MSTPIVVIDEPCGSGKSTGFISNLKKVKTSHPEENFLLVVPELGEVDRYLGELGRDWFTQPLDTEDEGAKEFERKIDALIAAMVQGKNIITTHALYARIRKFEHLLYSYNVHIDEVPTVAEEVGENLGAGIFKSFLLGHGYVIVDPITQLISATSVWDKEEANFRDTIDDKNVKNFIKKVRLGEVYFVDYTYQVMPLPHAFFTKPKALTVMTYLFKGSQLSYYMEKMGYKYSIRYCSDKIKLDKFYNAKEKHLHIYSEACPGKTGYVAMTGGSTSGKQRRIKLGNWVRNLVKRERRNGQVFTPDKILVASHKDAWWGKELRPTSKVANATRLKTLTQLSRAKWLPLTSRGTNDHRERDTMFILGKLNMKPPLAKFLEMDNDTARKRHTMHELVQLIYRSAIRDGKSTRIFAADTAVMEALDHFKNYDPR